ncbi:MAG: hypothetical protein JWN56_518 [Sphingobacteriales bacterium]|nr:hypothetical protein [Sphingobacteriales bacterium]
MILPFEYLESLTPESFDESTKHLRLQEGSSSKVVLLRSIIGSVKIKHTTSVTEFCQDLDYLDPDDKNIGIDALERLRRYLTPDLTIDEFSKYFSNKKFLNQNKKFFSRLNSEFSNYFYYSNKKSHTTAFIYIYRILETISYAFPLIYATKTDDFSSTYNFLKECLSGKGELGFFRKFISCIFENEPIAESSVRIDILASTSEIQKAIFDAIISACPEEIFDKDDTVSPAKLSVNFLDYSSFIINLRNRFVHLLNSGSPNLQTDEFLDSDLLFDQINRQSVNWLSIILVEVTRFTIEKIEPE